MKEGSEESPAVAEATTEEVEQSEKASSEEGPAVTEAGKKESDETPVEKADNEEVVLSVGAKDADAAIGADISMFVVKVDSLDGYAGNDLNEKVQSLVSTHPVVLISKTFCPFCLEAKRTLANKGVTMYVVEVDSVKDGGKIHAAVKESTGHKTVPCIFLNGKMIGGCDQMKTLDVEGKLDEMLKGLMQGRVVYGRALYEAKLVKEDRGKAVHPLFWFPNVVNNWVIRLTGVFVVVICIISIIFREELWGKYLAVFLLFDFTTRFVAGSTMSLLGMIAMLCTSWLKPKFSSGPPKQFAASCGLVFSLVATIVYFTGDTNDPDSMNAHEIGGAVVLGMLLGASFLQGFVDFCIGCYFYQLGVRFHILPDYVYRIYTNSREETIKAWDYFYEPTNPAPPRPEKVDTDPDCAAALRYKKKTDDWTREDFHPIRNAEIGYFAMPMSMAGLAVVWKIASSWSYDLAATIPGAFFLFDGVELILAPTAWWNTFAIAAAIVFCILLVLYTIRVFMYPRKVATEWQCPLRSNSFGMLTICFMLFAILVYDVTDEPTFGQVLWWIGAVPHMILTVIKFGEWIGKRLELEHLHATWLILPVGNFVAAMTGVIVPILRKEEENDQGEREPDTTSMYMISLFYFSFAFLMWLALFTITFFKTATTHNSDDRIRPSTYIWLAASAVGGLADFLLCAGRRDNDIQGCADRLYQYYFISIVFFLGLSWAWMPYINFFGRNKFDMNYWGFVFPLTVMAGISYLSYMVFAAQMFALDPRLGSGAYRCFEVLAIIFLVIATVACGVTFLHTLVNLVRRRVVFTPAEKWGPLSFMKLTHEAFRGAVPRIRDSVAALDPANEETIQVLAAQLASFLIMHEEHAKHEDEVIFKTFNDYFHEHARKWNDDHTADHEQLAAWQVIFSQLMNPEMPMDEKVAIVNQLKTDIPAFMDHMEEHLLGEEDHLNPVGRKYIPLALQKEMSRRVFELTPATKWEIIIPYIIKNLPRHPQRVRYLKVLTWAMPERAQQIGAILYRNVDAVMWERLRVEVPEIIPRGVYNWRRYY